MSSHVRTNGDEPKHNGETWLQPKALAQAGGFFADASVGDFVRIFYRHRRAALIFFASVMAATVLYVLIVPRQYRSEAKLFVRIGRENVGLDATTTLGQGSPVTSLPVSREEEINTVVAILESRGLLEKVVDAIGPATVLDPITYPLRESGHANGKSTTGQAGASPAPENGQDSSSALQPLWRVLEHLGLKSPLSLREKAVVALRKHLGIEAAKKSNVIILSHDGPSPKVSQQIVSKLVDFYLDEHVRMNRTPRAHQFLKEQATALKSQLTAQEDQLRGLKNATGLASPADQRQNLVLRIGRLLDDLKTSEATAAATAAESKEIGERLADMKPTEVLQSAAGFPNLAGDGMRQQLYALQLKEKDLASRMTDEHPELKFVRQQIANAKKILDAQEPSRTQTTVGPNRKYEELRLTQLKDQAQLASLRARGATLETQLADARREMQTLNGNEMRIGQVQRDIQILEGSYRKYADSLEQARIDESLERERISNINVAEAPTLNHEPIRPKALLTLVLGFALSLFGGLCLALAIEYFDHSLKTSDEIEHRLSLPVLASIPQINGRQLVARM
jgi:polysaccharide biosynthesis protein PslE